MEMLNRALGRSCGRQLLKGALGRSCGRQLLKDAIGFKMLQRWMSCGENISKEGKVRAVGDVYCSKTVSVSWGLHLLGRRGGMSCGQNVHWHWMEIATCCMQLAGRYFP